MSCFNKKSVTLSALKSVFYTLAVLVVMLASSAFADQKVKISKAGPATVERGGIVTYTITVTNTSSSPITKSWTSNHFLNGSGYLTFLPAQSTPGCAVSGQWVVCPVDKTGKYAPKETKTFTLVYKVPEHIPCDTVVIAQSDIYGWDTDPDWSKSVTKVTCAPKTQCADGIDNDGDGWIDLDDSCCANPSGTDEAYCNKPKVNVSKTGPSEVYQGGVASYTVTIKNNSNFPAHNVRAVDSFISGTAFTFLPAQSTPGCVQEGQYYICAPTSLAAGESKSYTFAYQVGSQAACGGIVMDQADVQVGQVSVDWAKFQTTVKCQITSALLPISECVYNLGSGKYRAYFGYENTGSTALTIAAGTNTGEIMNTFSPGASNRGQPSIFQPGRKVSAFTVDFAGESLTWNLRQQYADIKSVTVSKDSKACKPVKPVAECRDPVSGNKFTNSFSYQNDNPFDIILKIPSENSFVPSPEDRAQPNTFFPGYVRNVLSLNSDGDLTWKLATEAATANSTTIRCTPEAGKDCAGTPGGTAKLDRCGVCNGDGKSCLECTSTDIRDKLLALDITSNQLRQLIIKLTNRLQNVTDNDPKYDKTVRDARKEAEVLHQQTWILVWTKFRQVIINCTDTSGACSETDNSASISAYTTATTRQRDIALSLLRQVQSLRKDKDPIKVKRDKELVQIVNQLFTEGANQLATIPRFTSECR